MSIWIDARSDAMKRGSCKYVCVVCMCVQAKPRFCLPSSQVSHLVDQAPFESTVSQRPRGVDLRENRIKIFSCHRSIAVYATSLSRTGLGSRFVATIVGRTTDIRSTRHGEIGSSALSLCSWHFWGFKFWNSGFPCRIRILLDGILSTRCSSL